MADKVYQQTAKDLEKEMQQKAITLKSAATKFLNNISNILNTDQHILNLIKGKEGSLSNIYKRMQQSTDITRKCIEQQFIFEKAINKYLERTISLLYITQDGELLYGTEETAAEIYKTASAKKGGRGQVSNISQNLYKKLENYPSNITNDFKNLYQQRKNLYRPIYNKVVDRWLDNHDKTREFYQFWAVQQKKQDTFYWLIDKTKDKKDINRWGWSKRINRGQIGQTYAYLIWQDKNINFFDPNNEFHIGSYWGYMENHHILNSKAGIVEGDVIPFLSEFQNIATQFAVKAGSFNTASLGSYLQVAIQLSKGNIKITQETVKILLDKLGSYSYNLKNKGLKEAQKQLKKLFSSDLTK